MFTSDKTWFGQNSDEVYSTSYGGSSAYYWTEILNIIPKACKEFGRASTTWHVMNICVAFLNPYT